VADRRKRIVIALDTGSLARPAIETAAGLAIALDAELAALFIEDANLRRLAALPFAMEFGIASAQPMRLDVAALERAFGAQVRQLRRVLHDASHGLPLGWTLEVVRGDLVAVMLDSTADVLVLGRARRPGHSGGGPASRVRPRVPVTRHPILVVYDGSESGVRALEAAQALQKTAGAGVVVAITTPSPERFTALRRQADAILAAHGEASADCFCLPDIAIVGAEAMQRRTSVVLLPAADLAGAAPELKRLIDAIACPVVLVR
jgi:predicted phosphoribosyltransferase